MRAERGYELRTPATEAEWLAFHAIRRTELFEARGRFGVYDADHPDDRLPGNRPLLLTLDGRPVGVARLDDFGDGTGAVRLVAISGAEHGRGHGRQLQAGIESICATSGIRTLFVNAAATAVGFYEKVGWRPFVWDREELVGIAVDSVQMRKDLDSRH